MTFRRPAQRLAALSLAGVLALPALSGAFPLQVDAAPATTITLNDWANGIWNAASAGDADTFYASLDQLPPDADDPAIKRLRESVDLLNTNLVKREADRAAEIEKVDAELEKHLAEPESDKSLSAAIKSAVELYLVSTDKRAVMADPRIVGLINTADAAARRAEDRGDWLTASELFARLYVLLEEQGTYRDDLKRQGQRLAMIRLYAPHRLWELRNEHRLAEGEQALPPYNPAGDDFREKLAGVNARVVLRALDRSAEDHVDGVPVSKMLVGGLDAVRTLINTPDVAGAFPGLNDEQAKARLLAFLDAEGGKLAAAKETQGRGGAALELNSLVGRLLETNAATAKIEETALLHEFANGAMSPLDDFSAIIWPDEVRQFDRLTQGRFIGVGVQIQLDDLQNIKVVTPLEGTPAQMAGIKAGDLIRKVDGESTLGFSLEQAVEQITGPANTKVVLTIEREVDAPAVPAPVAPPAEADLAVTDEDTTIEKDFEITRRVIDLPTVKGWKRLSAKDDDWDWFVDRESGIGYVRLTQFTEKTTAEFDRAVDEMRKDGLRGLILDLRFNPGGLLTQAVSISNRFIDRRPDDPLGGVIVSTQIAGHRVYSSEKAQRGQATLTDVPVVVLVNENSASASEIVSGAIQDYAATGQIRAVVLGQRSYGKGSVQNVWDLPSKTPMRMKLTTQYYVLPAGRLIHRRPGEPVWGVEPNLGVEMLPAQQIAAIELRRDADVIPLDENGQVIQSEVPGPNPDDLIAKGSDLQLQAAMVLLQTQSLPPAARQAMLGK